MSLGLSLPLNDLSRSLFFLDQSLAPTLKKSNRAKMPQLNTYIFYCSGDYTIHNSIQTLEKRYLRLSLQSNSLVFSPRTDVSQSRILSVLMPEDPDLRGYETP
jgi:hypothetical protein